MLNHRTTAAAASPNGHPGTGHNKPPSTIESAREAFSELGVWMREHPVIGSNPEAKQGAAYVERTRIALSEMENERKIKVDPLNKQLSEINGVYRETRDPLETLLKTLRKRLSDFANAVEAARIAEANRLRQEAEERERLARAAEAAEQEAIDDAEQGVESDIGAAVQEADQTFADYRRADKTAAIAERNVPVRLASVMGGRALTMRTVEKLVIEDAFAAIKSLGLTPDIQEAILKSARAFRKEFEELPAGVIATFERSI